MIQILDAVFSGGSATPGSLVSGGSFAVGTGVTRVDSGVDLNGNDVFTFSVPIDFTFNAGDEFFIALFNDTTGSDGSFEIGVLDDAAEEGFFGSADGGASFFSNPDASVDFQLFGSTVAVPEPTGAGVIGVLFVSGLLRRRK